MSRYHPPPLARRMGLIATLATMGALAGVAILLLPLRGVPARAGAAQGVLMLIDLPAPPVPPAPARGPARAPSVQRQQAPRPGDRPSAQTPAPPSSGSVGRVAVPAVMDRPGAGIMVPPQAAPAPPEPDPAPPPVDAGSRARYLERLRARIAARRPPGLHIPGTAIVAFTLDPAGRLRDLALAQSSGSAMLDRLALRTVRTAAPFPAPPGDIGGDLRFSIGFRFD